jgi:hypothetical protein
MNLGWKARPSGLKLREDDFSWQGAVESEPRFFLRRSKDEPEKISDLLFGQLTDDVVELLLAEFMRKSGGISGSRLVFTGIGKRDDSHDATVAMFDRIAKIGTNAVVLAGRIVISRFLDQDGNRWNVVLELQPEAV